MKLLFLIISLFVVIQPSWDYTIKQHATDDKDYFIVAGHDEENPDLKLLQLQGYEKEFPDFDMYMTCTTTLIAFSDHFLLDPLSFGPIQAHNCPNGELRIDLLKVHYGDF